MNENIESQGRDQIRREAENANDNNRRVNRTGKGARVDNPHPQGSDQSPSCRDFASSLTTKSLGTTSTTLSLSSVSVIRTIFSVQESTRLSGIFGINGIYELRAKVGRMNYRILYFFHGKDVAVLSHGLTKESKVPPRDIDEAVANKRLVSRDPERYTKEFGE